MEKELTDRVKKGLKNRIPYSKWSDARKQFIETVYGPHEKDGKKLYTVEVHDCIEARIRRCGRKADPPRLPKMLSYVWTGKKWDENRGENTGNTPPASPTPEPPKPPTPPKKPPTPPKVATPPKPPTPPKVATPPKPPTPPKVVTPPKPPTPPKQPPPTTTPGDGDAKKQKIEELKALLAKKEEEWKVANEALILCKHIEVLKSEAKQLAERCANKEKLEADLSGQRTDADNIASEQLKVMRGIQGICGLGVMPKIEFTCEPIPLPPLGAPPPDRQALGKLPQQIKKSTLPPIIWHFKNLCLETPEPITQPKPQEEAEKAEIENLRQACLLFKKAYSERVCEAPVQNIKETNAEGANEEEGQEEANVKELQEQIEKLTQLTAELQHQIQAAKALTREGRRRILLLCAALKEREAAIIECSEMLCYIMDGQRATGDKILTWQLSKLKRYIEYLRWYLIRLNFEKGAQDAEIEKLEQQLKSQELMLLECLETRRRVCGTKKQKTEVTMGFDVCSWDF